MKLSSLFFAGTLFASSAPAAAFDTLSGDTRLACEALLCLSSGVQPGECAPGLNRYYSIRDKRFHRQIRKRIAFLNSCPTGTFSERASLVNAIAHGAGRCEMATLLRRLNPPLRNADDESPRAASSTVPGECYRYANHPYTYDIVLPVRREWCRGSFFDRSAGRRRPVCVTRWIDPRQPPSASQVNAWLRAARVGERYKQRKAPDG